MNADLQLRVLLIIVEHLMLMRFRVNEADADDHRFIHNTETWLFYEGVLDATLGAPSTSAEGTSWTVNPAFGTNLVTVQRGECVNSPASRIKGNFNQHTTNWSTMITSVKITKLRSYG